MFAVSTPLRCRSNRRLIREHEALGTTLELGFRLQSWR